jgi:hypothetical protein
MNSFEDRLRAAMRAAAGTVPPDSAPPLRLPRRPWRGLRLPGRRLLGNRFRFLTPVAAAAAVVAVVAVSFAAASGTPATQRRTGPVRARPVTGRASPAAHTPSAPASPTPGQSPTPARSTPPRSTRSPSGSLTVSITGLSGTPVLSYGGPPLQFGVYIDNGTARTHSDITFALSLAHCDTCYKSPAAMAPNGTMEEQDPATGQWHSIFYDREGTGMDYLNVTMPGFSLSPGATASFTFRIAFDPLSQQPGASAGETAIDVTLETLPSHRVIGTMPGATVPLMVAVR